MPESPEDIRISATLDRLGRSVHHHRALWLRLGNLETTLLKPDLQDILVKQPVYVTGLARSGSTLLLEILASLPDFTSHRYSDFPFVFTPYWWNLLRRCIPRRSHTPKERAHGDGMFITPESPEAMEEMLWMAFFPHAHNPAHSQILTASTENPAFESFYRQHIAKLLLARKRARYLSKGNYNVTRMAYLHKLLPDARFVLPVRDPASHIASLMRVHERFQRAHTSDPRTATHMSIAGHFEFGTLRTPIHCGDDARQREILNAWAQGNEVLGWGLYWDAIHRFIHTQLEQNPTLKAQTLVLRFEDICATPQNTLHTLLTHCGITPDNNWVQEWAGNIHTPASAQRFTDSELATIHRVTGETAMLFGYK